MIIRVKEFCSEDQTETSVARQSPFLDTCCVAKRNYPFLSLPERPKRIAWCDR